MTEPLIVDTDQLRGVSRTLAQAVGAIPAPLPKLSVAGSDPLSMMVAKGAVQVEAPMAALPQIKAAGNNLAEKIDVAGQKYSAVDQAYAERAKQLQQQFGANGGKPPQEGVDRNPLSIEEREKIRERTHDLQIKIMDRGGDVAGTASGQIGKAVLKGPGEVSEGLQKWFRDPGRLGFESGFTRSNIVTASIMAVPSAVNDIASGESVGKVVTSKAAGIGGGILAGGAVDAIITFAAAGSTVGPLGTAVGIGVGLVAAFALSGAAEKVAGAVWDGLFG